ncbi:MULTISPECIES: hypothetical protein [unclassified Kribbella]|uniref:hypothetical protein n=1 Tax=unclassified Kribbella TaxID=2644121 RepID=UPI0030776FD3
MRRNWPLQAATIALGKLPDDVGEQVETLMGLPYLHIDPTDEAHVVAIVRERGYQVRRDDALIARLRPS